MFAIALMLCINVGLVRSEYPFRNTSLSWDARVTDLVGRLTLQEIMMQLSMGGVGTIGGPAPAIPRLGIGPYSWNTECLRGDVGAGNATSFPQALGLAATFSNKLIHAVSMATSIEVRAKYNNYQKQKKYGDHRGISCFSPVINIMRHPLWGRNQETYGEDPFLSGSLAASFVTGLQGVHPRYIRANAGCKHFDVYGGPENIPVSRFSFDATVSELDWRTTFLPAFRSCVKAGTFSLMCSFNRINGVPACANKELLTDILRTEWGFKGYVVSDQDAIENVISFHHYLNNTIDTAAACLKAGCNLELSDKGGKERVYYSILDAVDAGKLTSTEVKDSVKPLWYTRMRLGEFDPPEMNPYTALNLSVLQSQEHRDLALKAAIESFVLLKNTNNFLPLKKKNMNIAIVGPMANNSEQIYGDYAPTPNPKYTRSALDGIRTLGKTLYAAGCMDNKCVNYSSADIELTVTGQDVIFVCLGTGQELEAEGNDRATMELPGKQLQLLKDAVKFGKGTPVVLLLFDAGPLNVTWADNNVDVVAIMECFFPAQSTGDALAKVLMPNGTSPAGRLPSTWPALASQVPPITNYTMHGRTYRYYVGDPLYPFGYGLSCTTFRYDILFVIDTKAGQPIIGEIDFSNIGPRDSDEVVQVYISWLNATVVTAKWQLVAFNRTWVKAGAAGKVQFIITPEQMAVWTSRDGWVVEPGIYRLYVGGQQPNQKRSTGSNIIIVDVELKGKIVLGKY